MRAYIKCVPGSAATKDRVSPVTVRGPQSVNRRCVAQLVLNPSRISRIRKVPGQMGVSRQSTIQSEINTVWFNSLRQVPLVMDLAYVCHAGARRYPPLESSNLVHL